ncbi:DUF2069 domain-containing protein [Ottowia sp. SB7-C50]|uniref:DUF2069 domain-containing protein n=1 Tax=Ottowia sp. SB7-C50 TaxID=3081231 RepID=UPI0029532681|nr:DUF2069 domain-containing protein [Ottowia sp. SB7-C50]WOP14713.1 DUF2069 domain-containing protein [Ottowia sp. SB7-C50]
MPPTMPTAALPNTPSAAALTTRAIAVICLLALFGLCLAWELWLAPVRPGGSWLAIKSLPLLLPLPGLLRLRMLTYRWTSLFVWLYFVEGVVRATSDRAPSSWYALGEAVLSVLLFAACAAHVRLRQRQARAAG